ncbi:MAG: phosphate acyltransferase [Bacteroidia bacterium]|nr:phosphate acyltransferase [Bacteroidia bacterium]
MNIGLDVLGGDFAPLAAVKGALLAQKELPEHVKIVLIGNEAETKQLITELGGKTSKFEYVHSTEVIGMGEHPTKALSQKPKSTIGLGFSMLKAQELDAFASAGNSGAMMVGAMFNVKTIPGVIRPVIATELPKFDGGTGLLLDVGLNADVKPDVLYQFGVIGSLYAQTYLKIEKPRVALMSLGEEAEKGNLITQAAYTLFKDSTQLNFVGNVEGRDCFNNKADVIACDGFTGNILLKQAESFYRMIKKRGIDDEYFNRFNYELYGGTPILGVNSTVIVGHGISNDIATKNMILQAKRVVDSKITDLIRASFN